MASLRITVKSVRTMVAHQYYFIICLHDEQLDPSRGGSRRPGLDPKLSGTSDVSDLTTNPEFKNKTFYFSINSSEGVSAERYLKESSLTCQLFATDSSTAAASTSYGTEAKIRAKDKAFTDELIQSSTHSLTGDEVTKLLSGNGETVQLSFKFGDVAVIHVDATCIPTQAILENDTCRTFLDDLYEHQSVLSTVQEQARHNSEESDRLKAQCSGLTYQNRLLQEEVSEMRQILDDERKAAKAAPQLSGWEQMSSEELYQRAEQSIGLYRKEQTRNTELMHQMKRMHAKAVEHENDMKRFHELQEAHTLQSKQIAHFEKENTRVDQYKSTCKTQEKIISRLERMLQAHLGVKEKLAKTEQELQAKIEENEKIKDEARHNELEVARAEVMTLHGSKSEYETKLVQAEKMQLAMTMRAEKAEVRAMAARNELIEATKRFAHEISTLKARLAEKDAQLLGGFNAKFGPLSNNFSTTTNASRALLTNPPVVGSHEALDPLTQSGSSIAEALQREGSLESQIARESLGYRDGEARGAEGPHDSDPKQPERNSPSPTTTLDPATAVGAQPQQAAAVA
ncbi:hypothetical protein HOP50_03g20130 [Chloropicon primus]|uniref:Uncharacterized protein n=1 Tax=Chloropicon primus TaxID=1764295 RepID=A0A5B8MGB6_9CHLO|nr:hypothetical protein A3770_03p20140 [Chloropicon primus]UPQ98707.1 hypothetical protein HOP50_03g20130 [Chloropicon primus]|eukprot:QDZ19496.1 hypothetical protein A3770_03p20140 [Chloropicon primus]